MSPCEFKQKNKHKAHALGWNVAIVYEWGCVLAAHVSVIYTSQIAEGTCCNFMSFYTLFCNNI